MHTTPCPSPRRSSWMHQNHTHTQHHRKNRHFRTDKNKQHQTRPKQSHLSRTCRRSVSSAYLRSGASSRVRPATKKDTSRTTFMRCLLRPLRSAHTVMFTTSNSTKNLKSTSFINTQINASTHASALPTVSTTFLRKLRCT